MKTAHAATPAPAFTLVATFLLLFGCASTKQASQPQPTGPLVLHTIPAGRTVTTEYETVNITGSQIPVRVPKVNGVRIPPTGSPVATMSPEQFAELQRRSMGARR